jgi:hypothetical protein
MANAKLSKKVKIEKDYYQSTASKATDFVIGFFGVWVVNALIGYGSYLMFARLINWSANYTLIYSLTTIFYLVILGLNIAVIILSFKRNRRYIGIGILCSAVLLPLLAFGACIVALSGL